MAGKRIAELEALNAEHAEAVRMAFDEAALVFGRERDWHTQGGPDTETEWAESDAKARLDDRRKEVEE